MSDFVQVGGKNKCSVNARYACNYGNIKSGKCPGYLVQSRKRSKKGFTKYQMKWHDGGEPNKPDGVDFISDRPLGHGVGDGNQPNGDNTMCLPHDIDGNVVGDSDTPNEYCELYRTEGRQQRGCVRDSGRRLQRRRGLRASPPPRRRRQQEIAVMIEEQRSPSVERPEVTQPRPQARSRSQSPAHKDPVFSARSRSPSPVKPVQYPEKPVKYHIPVVSDNENFKWLYVMDGFSLEKVKRNGTYMNAVFTTKPMKKGTRLEYHGRRLTSAAKSGNDEYVVTIDRIGQGPIFIDGNPHEATRKDKAVGLASFVNEPTTGKPNAELTYQDDRAFVELAENVEAGKEITVCYGIGYGKRPYKTSCPAELLGVSDVTRPTPAEMLGVSDDDEGFVGIELTKADLEELAELDDGFTLK
jgi:hypothetical protein